MGEAIRLSRAFAADSRVKLRSALMTAFIDEEPGTGRGAEATRYVYVVDKSPSQHDIEIARPGMINKGLDFVVRVPTVRFSAKRMPHPHVPSHGDLVQALTSLKRLFPKRYAEIAAGIEAVYLCKRPTGLEKLANLTAKPPKGALAGCPADVAVLTAKWLFAEQDVTYWNYSGRKMLFTHLRDNALA